MIIFTRITEWLYKVIGIQCSEGTKCTLEHSENKNIKSDLNLMHKIECLECGITVEVSSYSLMKDKGLCRQCAGSGGAPGHLPSPQHTSEEATSLKKDVDVSNPNKIGRTFIVISNESILKKDVSIVTDFLNSVCLKHLRSGQVDFATIVLSIDGYNNDSRSLWHVPEVREWFKALHSAHPYAPYFLSPFSIQLYIMCLEPFLPELLPKEYAGKSHHPVVYLVTYAMDQFMKLLPTVVPKDQDLEKHIMHESNERVFAAMKNLNEGILESI